MPQLAMQFIAPPKNQMAHLLHDMIKGRIIAEQDYKYNRFRGSISDLINEYKAPIRHTDVPFVNSFGRKSMFRKHYIMSVDKDEAIEIYNKVNSR